MGSRRKPRDIYLAYKIVHVASGKGYIGITGETKAMRWSRHIRSAFKENTQTALARAIRKYGPEAFTMTVIAEAANAGDHVT